VDPYVENERSAGRLGRVRCWFMECPVRDIRVVFFSSARRPLTLRHREVCGSARSGVEGHVWMAPSASKLLS
jgi:hypothetical protein